MLASAVARAIGIDGHPFLHLRDEIEARPTGQADVDDHRIPVTGVQQVDRLRCGSGDGDLESRSFEGSAEEGRGARIVLDDHDPGRSRGRPCGIVAGHFARGRFRVHVSAVPAVPADIRVDHHRRSVASRPLTVVRRSGICSTCRNGSTTRRLSSPRRPSPSGVVGTDRVVVVGPAAAEQGAVDHPRPGAGDDGCCGIRPAAESGSGRGARSRPFLASPPRPRGRISARDVVQGRCGRAAIRVDRRSAGTLQSVDALIAALSRSSSRPSVDGAPEELVDSLAQLDQCDHRADRPPQVVRDNRPARRPRQTGPQPLAATNRRPSSLRSTTPTTKSSPISNNSTRRIESSIDARSTRIGDRVDGRHHRQPDHGAHRDDVVRAQHRPTCPGGQCGRDARRSTAGRSARSSHRPATSSASSLPS